MVHIQNIRGIWKITASNPHSPILTRKEVPDFDGLPSTLRGVVEIPNADVKDLSPDSFWLLLLKNWEKMISSATGAVIVIIGDLRRDRIEDKSLPLYSIFYFPLLILAFILLA